jgi:hypothetical protein
VSRKKEGNEEMLVRRDEQAMRQKYHEMKK